MRTVTREQAPGARKGAVKLLMVDDHPLFRHGLRRVIEGEPDMVVCGEADDAARALELVESTSPDLAIIDLSLKGRSGLELIREVKALRPELPVLMLSMFDESLYAERALRAGAAGYMMKQEAAEDVITAIRRILQGHVHLSPALSSQMVRRAVSGPATRPTDGANAARAPLAEPAVGQQPAQPDMRLTVRQLSDRELEVFELIGQGLSTRRIAETLYRSVKTIESHRENIKAKLGVRSSGELLRFAVEHSLQFERGSVGEPASNAQGGNEPGVAPAPDPGALKAETSPPPDAGPHAG